MFVDDFSWIGDGIVEEGQLLCLYEFIGKEFVMIVLVKVVYELIGCWIREVNFVVYVCVYYQVLVGD